MGRNIFIVASVVLWALLTAACGVAATATSIATPEPSPSDSRQLFPLEEPAMIHDEGSTDETHGSHQMEHQMKESAVEGGGGESDVLEIALHVSESGGLAFDPAILEIPVGQRVKVTLINRGQLEHDIEVAALPAEQVETVHGMESSGQMGGRDQMGGSDHNEGIVAAHAMPGMDASVTFTPTRAGEYEFYCTIPGHKEAGMVGKLVVHQ